MYRFNLFIFVYKRKIQFTIYLRVSDGWCKKDGENVTEQYIVVKKNELTKTSRYRNSLLYNLPH